MLLLPCGTNYLPVLINHDPPTHLHSSNSSLFLLSLVKHWAQEQSFRIFKKIKVLLKRYKIATIFSWFPSTLCKAGNRAAVYCLSFDIFSYLLSKSEQWEGQWVPEKITMSWWTTWSRRNTSRLHSLRRCSARSTAETTIFQSTRRVLTRWGDVVFSICANKKRELMWSFNLWDGMGVCFRIMCEPFILVQEKCSSARCLHFTLVSGELHILQDEVFFFCITSGRVL